MFSTTRLIAMTGRRLLAHPPHSDVAIREKHSSTQIKRLFKRNPARFRVAKREGWIPESQDIPAPKFTPVIDPVILPNGWSAPAGPEVTVPTYPFRVLRTKNKPHDAVGFLPVYSEFRKDGAKVTTRIKKVSGNLDEFLSELRSVLQISLGHNAKDDSIRIRTGGTIEVKGNRVRELKHWLTGLGF